jgi:diguanylate cyclase
VVVHPDGDGAMRFYSYGTVTGETARPSLGALLADQTGEANKQFRIDGSIDPTTIPHSSFADILAGKGVEALRDKRVLVGATAIEMGDRYVVPGHGVLPGVVAQALGAETLLQGRVNPPLGPLPAALVALFGVVGVARSRTRRSVALTAGIVAGLLLALSIATEASGLGSMSIAGALFALLTAAIVKILLRMSERLERSARFDAELGLPNRRALLETFRDGQRTLVVALQLHKGDDLLGLLDAEGRLRLAREIGRRVQLAFPDTQLHALGASRFAWVVPDSAVTDQLVETLGALAALFVTPVDCGPKRLSVTPALGVAEASGETGLANALLAAADADASGQRWVIWSAELGAGVDLDQRILGDIDEALANRDLYLLFQPKWSVAKRRTTGAEALVRWRHASLGPIPPDRFVPVLETGGRIAPLTLFVLDECLDHLENWHGQGVECGLAVNISAALVADPLFVQAIEARRDRIAKAGALLTLEITESAGVESLSAATALLADLRTLGVRVSIDDYGTGHSTLSYLRDFPADEIKIDKSFVQRVLASPGDAALVRSTIALARELQLDIVAEGVEDQATLDRLADWGVTTIQGWHIGRAEGLDVLEAMLGAGTVQQAA